MMRSNDDKDEEINDEKSFGIICTVTVQKIIMKLMNTLRINLSNKIY